MQNQLYLVPFMKLMIRTSCSGLLKMGKEFLCRGGQDGPSQELFKCSVVLVFASVCSVSCLFHPHNSQSLLFVHVVCDRGACAAAELLGAPSLCLCDA